MKEVIDFGAERFPENEYINLLDETKANSLYGDDCSKVYADVNNMLPSFSIEDSEGKDFVAFSCEGKTFRYRTCNYSIRRYDEKGKFDEAGNVVRGHIYANKTAAPEITVTIDLCKNDILTLFLGSNGKEAEYTLRYPSGKLLYIPFGNKANIEKKIVCATETGKYVLWCSSNERLVVARVIRWRPENVTVTGSVSYEDIYSTDLAAPAGYKIVFKNQVTGDESFADVSEDGRYSISLITGYKYDISFADIYGYVASDNVLYVEDENNINYDVVMHSVDMVRVSGKISGLGSDLSKAILLLEGRKDPWYKPQIIVDDSQGNYHIDVEKGYKYTLVAKDINDYYTDTLDICCDSDTELDIEYQLKPRFDISVSSNGLADGLPITFINVWEVKSDGKERYSYTFKLGEKVLLRDGQYKVKVENLESKDISLKKLADVKVKGGSAKLTLDFVDNKIAVEKYPYKDTVEVGADKEFKTINEALCAVRRMERCGDSRVTILIDPGNYEEMLVVDVSYITLKNASATPSNKVCNKGVDIDPNAVRITSYYGHGYTYYSMGDDCRYDEEVLRINRENGYYSFENPGSGFTNKSYWNTTVFVIATGFHAEDIIFENSFNQYMSKKASEDVIVPQGGAREGNITRSELKAYDTKVQEFEYVERAAALAFDEVLEDVRLKRCRIISRQDTLYGGSGVKAYFEECAIYGSVDYIFGSMTAIFDRCELVVNISDHADDITFITAPFHNGNRGFLMWKCSIVSTIPGIDTASSKKAKPVYLGRPWAAKTGETVYYDTTIDTTDYNGTEESLIKPAGWDDSLSGISDCCYEYNTNEKFADNIKQRVSWGHVLGEPVLSDGTVISLENFS